MIGDVVGLRGGGEGKIEVGDDVAPLVWLGGVHVGVRFRDDPIGRSSRGDRDRAAEVALRRRNLCCGCFGRIGNTRLFRLGCFGRIGGARLFRLYRDA